MKTINELPEMAVTDGGDTWDWECKECGGEHKEDGPLGIGDELPCEFCGEKYRCV